MSFTNHTFSTTSSLAEVEATINNLAGYKSVYSLVGDGSVSTTTIPSTVTEVVFVLSDYSTTTESTPSSPLALPVGNILEIKMYVASDLTYTFPCSDGSGYSLTDTLGTGEVITLASPTWKLVSVMSSWKDKILRAKAKIKTRLMNHMKTDFGNLSISPAEALEYINNLEIFDIASDYLTLSLCYDDLCKGNANSQYSEKADKYAEMYYNEVQENLRLVALDLDGDGVTDINNYDVDCRILM